MIHRIASFAAGMGTAFALVVLSSLQAVDFPDIERIPTLTAEQAAILNKMSLVELDDGFGNAVPTLRLTAVNLQVVNGRGSTGTANGTGNLIVGYNEPGSAAPLNRAGSHNVVAGRGHNFESHGGIVAGEDNRIAAGFAGVLGGRGNQATDQHAVVVGGRINQASGPYSVVVSGERNVASSAATGVAGGQNNTADGPGSVVLAGSFCRTLGVNASVAGGFNNVASGDFASIAGGSGNAASGPGATVGGGLARTAGAEFDWVAGGLFEDQ